MHSAIEKHPSQNVDDPDRCTRTLSITASEIGPVLDAIGSETARNILDVIGSESRNTAEIAREVGTSLQNTRYHLDRLCDAGLVEVAGSRYSTKDVEMDVYAVTVDEIDVSIVRDCETTGHIDTTFQRSETTAD
jgi:DNA-binding transcriptional ArsR family regulator